jgi:anti-sigma B factor antagonist
MPETFHIREEQQDGVCLLHLKGFLDAHTAAQFETVIQRRVANGDVRLVVNCNELSYISSAGLGVFMSFIEELREQHGDIRIAALIPKVRQVFEILGFTEIFELFPTVDEAVASFQEKE